MTRRFTKLLQAALVLSVLCTPMSAFAEANDNLSKSEHQRLQQLTQQSGGTIQVSWDEKRGTPLRIAGTLSKPLKGEPLNMALTFMDSVKELYHFDKAKKSFRLLRVDHDELGMKHIRLLHLANGLPVWGDEVVIHLDKNNVVRAVNGTFTKDIEKNAEHLEKPTINSDAAVKNALDDLKVAKPSTRPTAVLSYFPYPDPDMVTLVYVVNVRDDSNHTTWKVFVDAITGDVVHKLNDMKIKRSHGDVRKLQPTLQ